MEPTVRIIFAALFFGAVFWFVGWLGRRKNEPDTRAALASAEASRAMGAANTKAVEENTAAIRELIAKLDERKL